MELVHIITAFLSGIGAVLSSIYALRRVRAKAERDCQQRIEEIKAAFHEGFEMRSEE